MMNLFSRFARAASNWFAHPLAFALAVVFVGGWALLGPVFHYSDSWQLVINTSTTILTFLMVFLVQNAQNRDSRVIQVKLDELLRAITTARNELIDLEHLSEEELEGYCKEFETMQQKYKNALEGRRAGAKPHAKKGARK
jgi:low affinity Fe/Cu permease